MGGCTALHQCAKQRPNEFGANKGKIAVAKILLEAGTNVQKPDKFGATPLHMACMSADPDGGLVSVLVEAGTDPTAVEPMFENTPVHWACQSGLPRILEPLFSGESAVRPVPRLSGRARARGSAGRDSSPVSSVFCLARSPSRTRIASPSPPHTRACWGCSSLLLSSRAGVATARPTTRVLASLGLIGARA